MPLLRYRSACIGSSEEVAAQRSGYHRGALGRLLHRRRDHGSSASSRSSSTPPRTDRLTESVSSCSSLSLASSTLSNRGLFSRGNATASAGSAGRGGLQPGLSEDFDSTWASGDAIPMFPTLRAPKDYVGFANLPNQVYRKAVKKGFEFNLMVAGETGLGKSTLVNSMFLADIYPCDRPLSSQRAKKTVQVEEIRVLLKEGSVDLALTIADTPGFGDAVDNTGCWQPIIDYIEAQNAEFYVAESRVHRVPFHDSRVHCCLYFIAPSGHGMKTLDIEFMKKLHDKVNIVPVIAKADTMTVEECSRFKREILDEIKQNNILIYEFPNPEDDEERKLQKSLKDRVPFAVVGSSTMEEVNGRMVRGRRYPWGVAEVENADHCDFAALRDMLIKTNMQDLKDITNDVHYENYRFQKLTSLVGSDRCDNSLLIHMEEEKKQNEASLERTRKLLEEAYKMKVNEIERRLKQTEADFRKKEEQMKKWLEQDKFELQERRRIFEKEKSLFEMTHRDMI
ncbi:hypothetical protein V5799_020116 [Amblyomma americanum]|uniref:Septin-type G domain-containing protein n=1 Tax=Amblyomma americanum TaxID=6943 RepID=A0AAQ4EV58_AMBAM